MNPHLSVDHREHRGGDSQPRKRSRTGQEVRQTGIVTGQLVPASWGIGTARERQYYRRPRSRRSGNSGNGLAAG